MTNEPLAARRILVVEDEWLIADHLEATLQSIGYDVIGPAPRVEKALELLETETPDAALLDVSLGREKSFPIAEALMTRGIPFIFLSGYVNADLPPDFGACPILCKPVSEAALRAKLAAFFSAAGQTRA